MHEPRIRRRRASVSAFTHSKSLPPRKATSVTPVDAGPRSPATSPIGAIAESQLSPPLAKAASPISAFALSVLERVSSAADFEATLVQLRATMDNTVGETRSAPTTTVVCSAEPTTTALESDDALTVSVAVCAAVAAVDDVSPMNALGEIAALDATEEVALPAHAPGDSDVNAAPAAVCSFAATGVDNSPLPMNIRGKFAAATARDSMEDDAPPVQAPGECAVNAEPEAGVIIDAAPQVQLGDSSDGAHGSLLASLRAALEESLLSALNDSAHIGDDEALRVLIDGDGEADDDESVGLLLCGGLSEESDGLMLNASSDSEEAGLLLIAQNK